MIEDNESQNVPRNPLYGQGCFRRRIRLASEANAVTAELEDDFHGFRLHLEHDGKHMTAVQAEGVRVPTNACSEAPGLLRSLIGVAIDGDRRRFRSEDDPRHHCTHLHDLLWLAVSHATREPGVRQYDVRVGDAR